MDQVLAVLKTAHAARPDHWLMFALTFNHGLRASEVVSLTPHNFKDGYLTIQRLKRSLKTTHELFEHDNPLLNEKPAVLAFLQNQERNQVLFPICRQHVWTLFRKYARAAGIPSHLRHPHILKHSIAMQLIVPAGIENTRQYLGHKRISSTAAYLRADDTEASAAAGRALGARPS